MALRYASAPLKKVHFGHCCVHEIALYVMYSFSQDDVLTSGAEDGGGTRLRSTKDGTTAVGVCYDGFPIRLQ